MKFIYYTIKFSLPRVNGKVSIFMYTYFIYVIHIPGAGGEVKTLAVTRKMHVTISVCMNLLSLVTLPITCE